VTRVKHDFAKHLRLHQTDVERMLWYVLRNRELARFKFRRQQPIGPYVVDFVCFHKKLILELDGDQHSLPEHMAADAARTRFLQSEGFRVKRFPNEMLRDDLDAVIREIALALGVSEDDLFPAHPQRATCASGDHRCPREVVLPLIKCGRASTPHPFQRARDAR
jgi:adenine-specific DNA-methyltransferase